MVIFCNDKKIVSLIEVYKISGRTTKSEKAINKAFICFSRRFDKMIRKIIKDFTPHRLEEFKDIREEVFSYLCENIIQDNFELGKTQNHGKAPKLSTYIYSITRNMLINELRKQSKIDNIDDLKVLENGYDLHQKIEERERNKYMEIAINQLNENCKELLKKYYYEDISLIDYVETLNIIQKEKGMEEIKYDTVKKRHLRCLSKLKGIFDKKISKTSIN